MNQKIVDYLQDNKEKYSQEVLVEQLKNTGYSKGDIQAGVKFVYSDRNIPLPKQSSTSSQQSGNQGLSADKKIMAIIGTIGLVGLIIVFGYLTMGNSNKEVCNGTDCQPQEKQSSDKKDSMEKETDKLQINDEPSTQKLISINGVDFIASQSEQTPPGGMIYNYVPKQENINQSISINILKRPKSSKETRDIYKGIAESMGDLKILDEWSNKKEDEYGFYGSKYNNSENETSYIISGVINSGSFQMSMRGVVVGKIEKDDVSKIISDFRETTVRLSQDNTFQNDFSNQKIIDVDNKVSTSKQSVLFNFDDFDFIVDEEAPNHLAMKSDEVMYMPTSQTVRPYEESGFLITTSIPVRYKQASEVCNDLKSSMEQSATGNTEIKDIEFHSDKVCGVYLYEKDNNKKINLWFKASFADNKMYKYIINSYGEGLSLEIVAGVTEEFKEFKY